MSSIDHEHVAGQITCPRCEGTDPQTEAGRRLASGPNMRRALLSDILAIEQQARAEGRREAALTISAELQHYDRSDDPGYITVPTERVRAILSPLAGRVAGLDASESGQPPNDLTTLVCGCVIDKYQLLISCSAEHAPSESPPPWNGRCAICNTGKKAHGVMDHPFTHPEDASESPAAGEVGHEPE